MTPSRKKWSGTLYSAAGATAGQQADQYARDRWLAAMRSPAPANWISNHLAEAQRLKGAVYLAVRTLGDQASMAQLKVSRWHRDARQDGDTDAKEPVEATHSLVKLLRKPNPIMTLSMLLKRGVQQVSLTGDALFWAVRNGVGKPKELWSVPTGCYQPVPPGLVYPNGGYRIQPYYPGPFAYLPGAWSAGGVIVPAEQMVAARHPHPLVEHEGLAPLAACDLALDTIEGIDRARMSKVRRGVNPSATLELDVNVSNPDPDDMKRVEATLRQLLQGPDKAGAIATLPAGGKLVAWGDGNVEVGWIESWDQLLGYVLSIFGVSKALAFLSGDVSFAELYAQLKQFDLFTMVPLLGLLADALNLQLVWPFWGEDIVVELEPARIDNEEEKGRKLDRLAKIGGLTVNEQRVAEGFEPTEEAWGEERAFAGKLSVKETSEETLDGNVDSNRKEPAEATAARPDNAQGSGSLGSRAILPSMNGHERN